MRSCLPACLYSLVFLLLDLTRLDWQAAVVLLPRITTGLLSALGDTVCYGWVRRREGRATAAWWLLLANTNWFALYSGSRTLVTSLEYVLVCLTLAAHPRPAYLGLVAVSVMLRPTAALVWLPVVLPHLLTTARQRGLPALVGLLVRPVLAAAALVLLDSAWYGRWTLTPYNFFLVNVSYGLASVYGVQPVFWYLSHALPSILGPVVFAAVLGMPHCPALVTAPLASTLITLSLQPHKEMRFLHCLLPLLLYSAAGWLARREGGPPPARWVASLALLSTPPALYLSLVHQRGVTAAAQWLGSNPAVQSALYLLPCHGAPLYSHAHRPALSLAFLTCQPNLTGAADHVDQADLFYSGPANIAVAGRASA